MMQVCPLTESQPAQFPKVEPVFGAAVTLTALPLVKVALQVEVQLIPEGVLITVPEPAPAAKTTVSIGLLPPPPVPVKQTTSAVMDPVTIAPDDPVFMVAETILFPQTLPVAVISPPGVTVTIWVSLEAHVTVLVMSLVTGG